MRNQKLQKIERVLEEIRGGIRPIQIAADPGVAAGQRPKAGTKCGLGKNRTSKSRSESTGMRA
jgi:hypothetical protein